MPGIFDADARWLLPVQVQVPLREGDDDAGLREPAIDRLVRLHHTNTERSERETDDQDQANITSRFYAL